MGNVAAHCQLPVSTAELLSCGSGGEIVSIQTAVSTRLRARAKFGRLMSAVIASLSIAAPTPAAAGLQQWQPVGVWSTKLQRNRCSAVRTFTRDSKQMDLVVEPRPTGGGVTLYFVIEDKVPQDGFITAKLAAGDQWYKDEFLQVAESARPNHTVYSWNASDEQFAAVTAASRLRVSAKSLNLDLPLVGISSAQAPLRDCISRLLAGWDFTAEQQARLASFPQVEEWNINDSDYPQDAMKRGAIGYVGGYLEVSSDGAASDCHVIVSSGWPDLDTKACELLVSRPKYKPAVDKSGTPMSAPFYFEFNWALPE
jgi:hypothetical protein